jgi:arabinogalactan oligomer / maltooligosaccharide transport system permease protein
MSATSAGPEMASGRGASPRPFPFLTGLIVKILFLCVINAVAIWAMARCIDSEAYGILAILILSTLALDAIYLTKRAIPAKYIFPGTLFLVVLYLLPVAYTVQTSFTNYGGSNVLTKGSAVKRILATSVEPVAGAYSFDVVKGRDEKLIFILTDADGKRFVGLPDRLEPIDEKKLVLDGDKFVSYDGAKKLNLRELSDRQDQITGFVSKNAAGEIRADSLNTASATVASLRYDAARDRFVATDGTEYAPKEGTYTATSDVEESRRILQPGFRAGVGAGNYTKVFGNAQVRNDFLRVFAWNVAFALGTVMLVLAVGMLLAMALNHPKLKGTKIWRMFLIVPYALPSAMMLLVWAQGLLNPKYGYINKVFGSEIRWLDSPWLARGSILLINTWLGFPYMFLLCTGLLQSIPAEFKEAASIDGATGFQTWRQITFPNLLIGLTPMLISTFAFNFNNFGVIYLTTRGGPPLPNSQSDAGQTDLLVTWTQKLAFGSGKGQQYGLASTISVFIFLIVGLISAFTFSQSNAWKEAK